MADAEGASSTTRRRPVDEFERRQCSTVVWTSSRVARWRRLGESPRSRDLIERCFTARDPLHVGKYGPHFRAVGVARAGRDVRREDHVRASQ
jgi:hypothetical protein